ncbi:PKD domain-containing protein [Maribellus comscasis]|uniref:PKD domain-containing protein n=1 Tax=Maribellus comscasis TaxID=2681766 RepID=A0A6I6JYC6_9BACT|nr:PKD domain-containing protein [Maribellus comscasis]QGY45227.1 PKD domain-containing protein [Maribellus comscasis]
METKKIFLWEVLVVSAVLFFACDKEEEIVTAAFTANSTEIETGETVSFSNESINAGYYQWDFGDGVYSFDEEPEHEYTSAGTYSVKLVAIGNDGSDSASVSINVEAGYDITIMEGEGIENIDIYDTWAEIQSVYSSTDTVHYIYDDYLEDYGFYYYIIYFYNEGIEFDFLTESSTLSNSDPVYYIWVLEPFEGATQKGISIGSDMDNVVALYGEPESTDEDSDYTAYWYDTQGIDFYSYGSGEVDVICVYEAYETSSLTEKSGNIGDRIRKSGYLFVREK